MKFITLLLLFFVCKAVLSGETVTQMYSGTDFVDQFELFNSSLVYINTDNLVYGDKTTPTQFKNVTDMACSGTNHKCIVAVDFLYREFTLDKTAGAFKFSKLYKVRDQSNFRIYSKVVFIEGSEYFLTSSLSKFGVNRFKLGDDSSFSQLKFTGIAESMECIDLLVVPGSKYALISYAGFQKIPLIDFVNMNEIRMIPGNAGYLALLTSDISQGFFVSAAENYITKYSFSEGTKVAAILSDYIVTGMKNVRYTDFVIVATWEQVYVYNFAGSVSVIWTASPYYYHILDKQMTGGVRWNQEVATMYFAGVGHITSLTGTNPSFCHPHCSGCSLMLSEFKCTACTAPATLEGAECRMPADKIKSPPGGTLNYTAVLWSDNNMKLASPAGFNIKDYYLYIIIGAGGLVGLCCIFCICKMCCKKNDDERNNRVRHQNKDC